MAGVEEACRPTETRAAVIAFCGTVTGTGSRKEVNDDKQRLKEAARGTVGHARHREFETSTQRGLRKDYSASRGWWQRAIWELKLGRRRGSGFNMVCHRSTSKPAPDAVKRRHFVQGKSCPRSIEI